MKHLSIKKLFIQFFIVGAYMGYHISNGFGFGINNSGQTISISSDEEIQQEQSNTSSQNKKEVKLLVRFEDNLDPYLDNFSTEETQILNYFIAQTQKAQKWSWYDQNVLYTINQLLLLLHKNYNLEKITADFKGLDESSVNGTPRNNLYTITFQAPNIKQVIEQIKKAPFIKYVEPVPELYIAWDQSEWDNNDRYKEATELNKLSSISLEAKQETIVAVIDNAIDTEQGNIKQILLKAYDIADEDNNTIPPIKNEKRNHGTYIASIIADNSYNTKLLAIKIASDKGDGSQLSHLIEGIQRAIKNNANVINLSLWWCLPHEYSNTIRDIILSHPSILFVAAGGNNGINPWEQTCEHPLLGTLQAGSYGYYPAAVDSPNMIAVAATNKENEKRSESNIGEFIDIAAPWENIYSKIESDKKYRNGTSVATAIVTAIANTIRSVQSEDTDWRSLKKTLISNTDPLKEKELWNGLINMCKTINTIKPYQCSSDHKNTNTQCNNNNICEDQEDSSSCPWDCSCNDNGICESERAETTKSCETDCKIETACNQDNICQTNETIKYCRNDCGCNFNYQCETQRWENTEICPTDCNQNDSYKERICNDHVDNDKDWLIDCRDTDCKWSNACYLTIAATGSAECGNGIVVSDEECDDGNSENNDWCNSSCKRETPTCKVNIVLGQWENSSQATVLNLGYVNQTRIRVKNVDWWENSNQSTNITIPVSHTYEKAGSYNTKITLENKNDNSKSIICSETLQIESIQGCTDPKAKNYDPKATTDDGTCTYKSNGAFYCDQLHIQKITEEDIENNSYTVNFKWTINQDIEYVSLYPWEGTLYRSTTSPLWHSYSKPWKYNAKFLVKIISWSLYNCSTTVEVGKKWCTYEQADNYDSEAAIEDWSCVISPGKWFVKILTRIPYRNNSFNWQVQYSHTPNLVKISAQLSQDWVVINEFYPVLYADGTFSIKVQHTDPSKENYLSPGEYTILYTATHRKGNATDSQSYQVIIK